MSDRSNVWAFIIYPDDSCPNNYLNIIENWHIPALVSPIHDKDLNADETEKKKHIHIMLYFGKGANKSFAQVKQYSDQLCGTIPIIINNTNAMIRYFIHFDNPEKHQYKRSDLICISGFEINDAFESYTNDSMYYDFIEEWIKKYDVFNIFELMCSFKDNNLLSELDFMRRHSVYIRYLLDGKKSHKKKGNT